jgi:hypothetical protein
MLCQPALSVIEGEKGALLLAPVRRPCCLELFCYQESLFRAWSWRPDRTRVGAISVNHPYRHIRGKGGSKGYLKGTGRLAAASFSPYVTVEKVRL